MIVKQANSELLQTGLAELNIEPSNDFVEKIQQYIALLIKWNKVYNLTAITDPQQIIVKHIFDSLAVSPYLQGTRFIDVGTGAGLPGIPLALANPNQSWCLLDSLEKRMRFLLQVKHELALDNIEIVTSRVEKYQPSEKFDGVVTRAYSSLPKMLKDCGHLSQNFYAMKAHLDSEEDDFLQQHPHQITALHIPYLDQVRQLVQLKMSNLKV